MKRVEARLFGPETFEPSKLQVVWLNKDHSKIHPSKLPRTYTLTHSDITAKLTLSIAPKVNEAQIRNWYSRLQRDEVVAEWKQIKGQASLHVHCHISGGNWYIDAAAPLRDYIFRKELPLVLQAFQHGDNQLLQAFPELDNAPVWIYFHSKAGEFRRVECWGTLADAAQRKIDPKASDSVTESCSANCDCCSHRSLLSSFKSG